MRWVALVVSQFSHQWRKFYSSLNNVLSLEIEEIRKNVTFIKNSEVKPIWIGIMLGWVTLHEV